MSLEEKLAALRSSAAKRIPPERLAIMHDATEQLRHSGILDQVIKPGTPAPDFTLNDQNGNATDAVGTDGARSCAYERVPRLLVTVLPA